MWEGVASTYPVATECGLTTCVESEEAIIPSDLSSIVISVLNHVPTDEFNNETNTIDDVYGYSWARRPIGSCISINDLYLRDN